MADANPGNGSRIPDDLTRLRPVAEACDVNERTVRRWIADGKLTAYRIAGTTIRVSRRDVEKLIAVVPTTGTIDRS